MCLGNIGGHVFHSLSSETQHFTIVNGLIGSDVKHEIWEQ